MTIRGRILASIVIAGLSVALLPAASAAGVQRAGNSAVIELGGTIVTRDQLDARFQVAARLLARRQGVSFAAQKPAVIERLRAQYLQKRATELVLLQEAAAREIDVPAGDVQAAIADIPPAGGDAFLRELEDAGVADGADILHQIVTDERTIAALTKRLLDEIEVPPGDVLTFYHDTKEQLATPERVCIRHIQVPTLEAAEEVRAALLKGADFAGLAAERSTDTGSAKSGGDIGCFAKSSEAASAFQKAAFSAEEDEIVGPIASKLGYHVLQVYEHEPRKVPTLDEAYDEIADELARERLPAEIAALVDRSGVRTFPEHFAAD